MLIFRKHYHLFVSKEDWDKEWSAEMPVMGEGCWINCGYGKELSREERENLQFPLILKWWDNFGYTPNYSFLSKEQKAEAIEIITETLERSKAEVKVLETALNKIKECK